MSVKILADRYDKIAIIYDQTTERALGPVFGETEDGEGAEKLAKKFLEWVQGDILKMDYAELMRRRDMFIALKWKACPWSCPSTLIQGDEESCQECLTACEVCFDEGVRETKVVVIAERNKQGLLHERRIRACQKCTDKTSARIL